MRASGGVGHGSTDYGPESSPWRVRGRRGVCGGRAVGGGGGVAYYLAFLYEDVARKTQGN